MYHANQIKAIVVVIALCNVLMAVICVDLLYCIPGERYLLGGPTSGGGPDGAGLFVALLEPLLIWQAWKMRSPTAKILAMTNLALIIVYFVRTVMLLSHL